MRAAQKALRRTGELTVQDAINQVEIVNMVTEGIQQAMKNPPTSIIDEHHQETANLAEENSDKCSIKWHNNNNIHLPTHSRAINSQTTNRTTINNSTNPSMIAPTRTTPYDLNVGVAETTIITTPIPTLKTVRVGATEGFIVGLTDNATTQ
eukprot:6015902-Ditylum_brightwellii.AAC.1